MANINSNMVNADKCKHNLLDKLVETMLNLDQFRRIAFFKCWKSNEIHSKKHRQNVTSILLHGVNCNAISGQGIHVRPYPNPSGTMSSTKPAIWSCIIQSYRLDLSLRFQMSIRFHPPGTLWFFILVSSYRVVEFRKLSVGQSASFLDENRVNRK